MKKESKKAQVTIFVIIAVVVVGIIAGFFFFKDRVITLPTDISDIKDSYISCISNILETGASIMESQAGYIYVPEFEPGSEYAPFSSQMDFLGRAVPYWFYVSGNGLKKEQIPTKTEMENQLKKYLTEEVKNNCDDKLRSIPGYTLTNEEQGKFNVKIYDEKIEATIARRISVKKGEESYILENLKTTSQSKLGKYYALAKKIYDYEKTSMILENYSVDVLYNYAPVTGVNVDCSPSIWDPYNVFGDLKNALQANLGTLKFEGADYTIQDKKREYFVISEVNLGGENARILYSKEWPSRFEVWPTKSNMMIAKPIGNQQGMGMLGFCYIPYKFVYDMYFPVLIQIYDSTAEEIFQFPIAIVVDKNYPREALDSELYENAQDICDNANTDIEIETYNNNLEAVEANLDFKCLTSLCSLGKTQRNNATGKANLIAKVPQCVNGVLIANSDGYKEKKYIISTNEESSAQIFLDRTYNLQVQVYVDGQLTQDLAVISINEKTENSSSFSQSLAYPYGKNLEISEGNYEFELRVYSSGEITIPATTTRQCVNAPQEGLLGLFGLEKEKCYNLEVPSQKISHVPKAGGKQNIYFTPDQLSNSQVIRIDAKSIASPSSLEEIDTAYTNLENKKITISLI